MSTPRPRSFTLPPSVASSLYVASCQPGCDTQLTTVVSGAPSAAEAAPTSRILASMPLLLSPRGGCMEVPGASKCSPLTKSHSRTRFLALMCRPNATSVSVPTASAPKATGSVPAGRALN
jgi:hypothetical protein